MNAWEKISEELHLDGSEEARVALLQANTRGDRVIWSIVVFLVVLGMLAVYSSTGTLAYTAFEGKTSYFLFKQISFIVVGVAIIYFTHLADYRIFSRIALWLYLVSIPLLLYTLLFGASLNEASRWIKVPVINLTFQTSDFARLALFMYIARQLSRKQKVIHDFKKGFLPLIIPIALTCLLIAPANLSTALLTGATGMLLLFLGRVSMKHLLITLGIMSLPVVILVVMAISSQKTAENTDNGKNVISSVSKAGRVGTWISRIQDFMYAKGEDAPYQLVQAKIAVAKGGWFGLGPGNSEQRNYLPHSYSDFIFSIIIEEYGVFGGFIIMMLYMVFLYRCIIIIRKSPKAFGAFLSLALSMTLVIQALINMAVNIGLFPVTGVTLPLISMGGTSFLFTCFSIGIILSISRYIQQIDGTEQPTVTVVPEVNESGKEEVANG
ncbi:MAG: FtsW/RodA/SpoVE family cell cycle protein [Chitinophagaceae bacterium]|nr:FtsW/RodA/SpoVE family cell cycle protein [Chitinophagaceae bacterium]